MIGLLLVTHGRLGLESLAVLEHIAGPQMQAVAVAIGPEDDLEYRQTEIREHIARLNSGQGVIIATDVAGSSPARLAQTFQRDGVVEVMTGFSIPLLVKLATARKEHPLSAVVQESLAAGRKYMRALGSGEKDGAA